MNPNVPGHVNRRTIEHGLAELRKWRRTAVQMAAQSESDPWRRHHRQLADDLEAAVFHIERALHPMNGDDQ